MTPEQADRLAEYAASVDGGCIVCVSGLLYGLDEIFPEFDWPALIGAHLERARVYTTEELRERLSDSNQEGRPDA